MHLSQWTTNQETYMVTICTFIKSNNVAAPYGFNKSSEVFKAFRVISWSTGLIPVTPGPGFCSWTTSSFWKARSNQQQAGCTATGPSHTGAFACIESLNLFKKRKIKSLCRDRASGQSRGVQVTLKFPYCTSVQGAKVEVKSSVCDVEVSCLFNEIDNLEKQKVQWVSTRYISPDCNQHSSSREL